MKPLLGAICACSLLAFIGCGSGKNTTATTLKASSTTVYEGVNVTLTANVTPPEAPGTVTFLNGSTTLGTATLTTTGTATLSTSFSTAGSQTITASYAGADNYKPSTSPALTIATSVNPTTTLSFANALTLSSTAAPGVWFVDRFAPHGFAAQATAPDSTTNTLKESIAAADFQPASVNPTWFYDIQGYDYNLPAGVVSTSISLYVPAAWKTGTQGSVAGFWTCAVDAGGVCTGFGDYPLIEFQTPFTPAPSAESYQYGNGGVAGFYGWNNVTGNYDLIGLPDGFQYNSWVTLTITLIPGQGFQYTVASAANSLSVTSPFCDATPCSSNPADASFSTVLLQGYNYDADYQIYWNNLSWTVGN